MKEKTPYTNGSTTNGDQNTFQPLSVQGKTFSVNKKSGEWWQLAGQEMTEWYGQKCYWIFWKFKRGDIERNFQEMQKVGDRNFTHLLQRLNHG